MSIEVRDIRKNFGQFAAQLSKDAVQARLHPYADQDEA